MPNPELISLQARRMCVDYFRRRFFRSHRAKSPLRIQVSMRNDDWAVHGLQRGLRGLHVGMREIDQDAQPIPFLDDG